MLKKIDVSQRVLEVLEGHKNIKKVEAGEDAVFAKARRWSRDTKEA